MSWIFGTVENSGPGGFAYWSINTGDLTCSCRLVKRASNSGCQEWHLQPIFLACWFGVMENQSAKSPGFCQGWFVEHVENLLYKGIWKLIVWSTWQTSTLDIIDQPWGICLDMSSGQQQLIIYQHKSSTSHVTSQAPNPTEAARRYRRLVQPASASAKKTASHKDVRKGNLSEIQVPGCRCWRKW